LDDGIDLLLVEHGTAITNLSPWNGHLHLLPGHPCTRRPPVLAVVSEPQTQARLSSRSCAAGSPDRLLQATPGEGGIRGSRGSNRGTKVITLLASSIPPGHTVRHHEGHTPATASSSCAC